MGFSVPMNDVVSGEYQTERLAIGPSATIAEMLPGIIVTFDTTDHDVQACGVGGDFGGWLGYGEAHSTFKPADRDTAYTALGDEVPVHKGVGFPVRARCASTSFVKDDLVTMAAGGLVAAGTVGSDHIVGSVLESTTAATTVWVMSMI